MNASEVLKRYAEGRRDFRRENLRGMSFRGQDLSGADFSEADIRGTKFQDSILRNTKFIGARSGHKKISTLMMIFCILFLSIMIGFVLGFTCISGALLLRPEAIEKYTLFPIIVITILLLAVLAVAFIASFEKAIGVAVLGGAGAICIAIIRDGIVPDVWNGAMTVVGILVSISILATVIVSTTMLFGRSGRIIFLSIKTITTIIFIAIVPSLSNHIVAVILAIIITALVDSIALYISRQAINGNSAYSIIYDLAIIFTTINSTSFKDADLTDVDFTNALLIFVDFRSQQIIRTCWRNAKKLEYAKVDDTILSHPEIRELLVTGNGHRKFLKKANLRYGNLTEVDLSYANLKQADLSQAVLRGANLEGANLTETNCVGSDFTAATLTAVCLEAWNIDSMTILERVNCDFVFLLEEPNPKTGSRERCPYDINAVLRPGDFEKLYGQVMNTVDILLRNAGNSEVFHQAFQELMGKHPEIDYDSIQSLEKKGEDVLIKIAVSEETDKAEVAHSFRELYEAKIEAVRQAALLEAEVRHNQDLIQIISGTLKQLPSSTVNLNNNIQQETKSMSDNQEIQTGDVKGNFAGNVGGNFDASGAVFNIDNIKSSVSNSINELPPSSDPEQPGIKELLDQLKTAISESSDLNDADKAQALEQVNTLAEAGQNPKDSNMQQQAKGALRFLKGLMAELPTITKLVKQCQEWFPTISKFFGL